jgi:hypothetical protein
MILVLMEHNNGQNPFQPISSPQGAPFGILLNVNMAKDFSVADRI